MTERPWTAHRGSVVLGGVETLERALGYTQGSLQLVSPSALDNPTPCREWTLRELLAHMADSLIALSDAAEIGQVDLEPGETTGEFAVDVVNLVRQRACHLLGAWTAADGRPTVAVGDRSLESGLLTGAGALEIAVHGWDVARACGQDRPIPAALAEDLIELAPALVADADRPERFADPVRVSPLARPSDQLTAWLGREV
jgi:uncharacterized protein (TIGR03086 family)